MRPTRSPVDSQHWIVVLLSLMASAAVLVVRVDASWNPLTIWIPTLVSAALCLGVAFGGGVKWVPDQHLLTFRAIFTAILVLLPLLQQWINRAITGYAGEATELLMLASLQQGALAAAAYANHRKSQWISGLQSFFLVLFSVAMSIDPVVYVIAAMFALLGIWWLMGSYWERIQGGFVAQQSVPVARLRLGVLLSLAGVLLIFGGISSRQQNQAWSLRGFMPTSGGDGESDPTARSGIGDGDQMVAAKDQAMSFGPVESELFLEDPAPSLYDMFSEFYGDKPKIKKRHERAISLAPNEGKENHQKKSQSQRSSKDFAAVRRAVDSQKKKLDDRKSPALLYLIGEVPAHLTLETFSTFDGVEWMHQEEPVARLPLTLENRGTKPWIRFQQKEQSQYFINTVQSGVKIINLQSPRIASLDHLAAIHIDKVNVPEFYGWTQDGVAEMSGRDLVPQLTVLQLETLRTHIHRLRLTDQFRKLATAVADSGVATTPDQVQLRQQKYDEEQQARLSPFSQAASPQQASDVDAPAPSQLDRTKLYREIPVDHSLVQSTAQSWVVGVPRGWRQVEAIIDRLREEYELDGQAVAPEDCEDVVKHFLQSGRGPDYLFATTAAMLLRSIGYPTRLATGMYADPANYDRMSGQTIVRKEDLHTWVQVSIDGQHWISVEPTPGYLQPREELTWMEWAQLIGWEIGGWVRQHPWHILAAISLVIGLVVSRRWWIERLATLLCLIASQGSTRRQVTWTLWLLEFRAWMAGCPRPKHQTIRAWYSRLTASAESSVRDPLGQLLNVGERLLYAPKLRADGSIRSEEGNGSSIAKVCFQVISVCSVRDLARWSQAKTA